MRDLSERPLHAAALAPLVSPIVVAAAAVLGESLAVVGKLDALVRTVLLIWLVAYTYMWAIALPVILFSRRWIRWTWPRLVALGAFVGASPWLMAMFRNVIGIAMEESWPHALDSLSRGVEQGERMWLLFAACGAGVAGTFCGLQSLLLKRSSRDVIKGSE